jgi:hypothetical protein
MRLSHAGRVKPEEVDILIIDILWAKCEVLHGRRSTDADKVPWAEFFARPLHMAIPAILDVVPRTTPQERGHAGPLKAIAIHRVHEKFVFRFSPRVRANGRGKITLISLSTLASAPTR